MEQLQAFDGGTCGTSDLADVLGVAVSPAPTFPAVLDACCGRRMMWFDKQDDRAIFADKRRESYPIPPNRGWPNGTTFVVAPNVLQDFADMEFPDNTFWHVVFDPPHCNASEGRKNGLNAKTYGLLFDGWRAMLREGFAECFRVLKPNGTLIFKWCEAEIPLREVLALTPEKPLYGHRSGKKAQTHWVAFMKTPNVEFSGTPAALSPEAPLERRVGGAVPPAPTFGDKA